jgi:hypothetical protein
MSYALFSVPFQAKRIDVGPVIPEEGSEAQVAAFPRSPARHAQADPAYRAFKVTPLASGALLFSAVRNRGGRDAFGRPVLHANGCILHVESLLGPERDPAAVLMALDSWSESDGESSFAEKLSAVSAWSSETAFEAMRSRLAGEPQFHAEAALALTQARATFSWSPREEILPLLQPVLVLLSVRQLARIDLATGSADSNHREAILGIAGNDPGPASERAGFLTQLLGRSREARVDFHRHTATGSHGPRDLVDAIATPSDWGLSSCERLRLLLQCLDAGVLPPEAAALPEEAQRTLRRVEAWSRRIGEGK